MIEIDGSLGEGGGQILRSSLALSMITGIPFRLSRIRAARRKPGLQRQHLTAVKAAAEVCGAGMRGATLNSSELSFAPGPIRPGDYEFAIGTAGSTSLVLQTVLPALLTADAPSTVALEGGTHNEHAPPFEFLDLAFLPLLNRLGPRVTATLERPGYYPAGGGHVEVRIEPAAVRAPSSEALPAGGGPAGATSSTRAPESGETASPPRITRPFRRLELCDRGLVCAVRARAVVSKLPRHIAEREIKTVESLLRARRRSFDVVVETRAAGPGNVLLIEVESDHVTEVFTGFGKLGVSAEMVATTACGEAQAYLDSDAPVGPHLADQLLLPLALGEGGTYLAQTGTEHLRTNADVIRKFLDATIDLTDDEAGRTLVEVTTR